MKGHRLKTFEIATEYLLWIKTKILQAKYCNIVILLCQMYGTDVGKKCKYIYICILKNIRIESPIKL